MVILRLLVVVVVAGVSQRVVSSLGSPFLIGKRLPDLDFGNRRPSSLLRFMIPSVEGPEQHSRKLAH